MLKDNPNDMWEGSTPYEKELTEETFQMCTRILTELPFTKTEKEKEPNMITIRNKKRISQHPDFQIWRENDVDCSYFVSWLGSYVKDPTKIKVPKKLCSGKYMIEMSCGVDSVLLT
jgi:hypothetical protein